MQALCYAIVLHLLIICLSDLNSQSNVMDAVDVAKTVSIVILGLFAFGLGMLPIIIVKKLHWRPSENGMSPMAQSILSGILCFGGGVLMATSLIHLLPEIQRGFEELQKTGEITTRMPLGEIMFAAGFFFVYFVEECVHYLSAHHHRKQSDTSSIVQIKQPVSDLADHGGKSQSSCSSECDMRQLTVDQDTEKNSTDSAGSQHDDQDAGHHHHGFVEGGGDGLATLRGFLIVVGLSIHGIFEGLAVGLEKEARDVWMLCGAISIHKFVIAICIGLEMASSGVNIVAHALYLFIFSLVTPLGGVLLFFFLSLLFLV